MMYLMYKSKILSRKASIKMYQAVQDATYYVIVRDRQIPMDKLLLTEFTDRDAIVACVFIHALQELTSRSFADLISTLLVMQKDTTLVKTLAHKWPLYLKRNRRLNFEIASVCARVREISLIKY